MDGCHYCKEFNKTWLKLKKYPNAYRIVCIGGSTTHGQDMEYFEDPAFAAEKQRRIEQFQPFQVNREILRGLDTVVMHCLPAHRGYEIEGELLEDPRSLVFHQAENRLHSQKAVLLHIAGLL